MGDSISEIRTGIESHPRIGMQSIGFLCPESSALKRVDYFKLLQFHNYSVVFAGSSNKIENIPLSLAKSQAKLLLFMLQTFAFCLDILLKAAISKKQIYVYHQRKQSLPLEDWGKQLQQRQREPRLPSRWLRTTLLGQRYQLKQPAIRVLEFLLTLSCKTWWIWQQKYLVCHYFLGNRSLVCDSLGSVEISFPIQLVYKTELDFTQQKIVLSMVLKLDCFLQLTDEEKEQIDQVCKTLFWMKCTISQIFVDN